MSQRSSVTPMGRILIVLLLLAPIALAATCFRSQIRDALGGGDGDMASTEPPAQTAVIPGTRRPDGNPQRTPTAAGTRAGGTGTATAPPGQAGGVICAYDAFDPYQKCPYIQAKGLIQGFPFAAKGFGLDYENPTEAQKLKDLSDGKYQVLLTTVDSCALNCTADTIILALVDASTGADMFVTRDSIRTLNDMAGQRACFVDGSVSEAFFLELFGPLQLIDRIGKVPNETLEEALDGFERGECAGVVGWQPDMLRFFNADGTAKPGYRLLADTSRFQYVLDAVIANKGWVERNPGQAQAFVDAWFRALKDSTENTPAVSRTLIEAYKNVKPVDTGYESWADWSGIVDDRVLGERLSKIVAEASLDQNAEALANPDILARRIDEARVYWRQGGKTPGATPAVSLIDNRFVLEAAKNRALQANRAPLNRSFYLAERIPLPALTAAEAEQVRRNVIAKLPLEKLDFLGNSAELKPGADAPLIEIAELIKRSPGVYLVIEGRAAKPCGQDPQGSIDFARARAERVARVITADPLVQKNQVIVAWPQNVGDLRSRLRFYDSCIEGELEQDRVVLFTLNVASGQR